MPRWLATLLVITASVTAFAALLAVWVDRQVLNTDNWASASSRLLENPAIRSQTAEFLADRAYEDADLEGQIRAVLPPRAQPLAAPAAGFLRDRLERRANEALARPDVQQLWEDANRDAHARFLEVLDDDGPLVIDLHRLLVAVERRAGVGGRVAAAVEPGAAQVVLLDSGELGTAREVARLLDALPVILVVLSLLLAAAALAGSPGRRRRVVRGFGIGLVAAGSLALGAWAMAGDAVVASAAPTADSAAAARAAWEISGAFLVEAAIATVGYGLVLVAAASLAGPARWAVATRRVSAPLLREPELAYGALAVLVGVVFLWWAPTPAMRRPLAALVLIVMLVAGFEALRRLTAREFPPALEDPAPAATPARADSPAPTAPVA